MARLRRITVACAAAILLALAVGSASSLASSSASLGTSGAAVSRCQTTSLTVTQNLSGSNVVSVTVAGISSTCGNGVLSAAVDNLTASSSGSVTIPAGGGSVTATLGAAVALKDVERVDVSISGP